MKRGKNNSQLQQSQIRIAVIGPVFALLRHVVLEYARRFGVVAVQTVEDGFDVRGPVGRVVEGYAHGYEWCVRGDLGVPSDWSFCGTEYIKSVFNWD